MPYTARFSKVFLKKEKQLPSEVKSRIVKTLKETPMKPDSGIMLVGPLKGLWKVRV
jgi:mRNA-degrading endonuclease RelE of RelBE toxin-antitoxin system